MPTPRVVKALQDLEAVVIANRPQVTTKSPTPSYPHGFQEVKLRRQVSVLALQASQVQIERIGEI